MTSARVAVHVHSSWSYDGEWTLPEIARAFSRRRYDVVLMSEHDRSFDQQRWEAYQEACKAASTNDITLIPGIEYEDADNIVHTPVWGGGVPFLGAGLPTLDLLKATQEEGAVAVLAHPWRKNAISRYQPEWAPLLCAVEIWNRKYDGFAPNAQAVDLVARDKIEPFVSLDFHTSRQFFPLAMSMILDGPPTPASLTEAIRKGQFQPEFLGFPAMAFTGGAGALTLRALEITRRRVRDLARRLR
jgi:hypothetical protein